MRLLTIRCVAAAAALAVLSSACQRENAKTRDDDDDDDDAKTGPAAGPAVPSSAYAAQGSGTVWNFDSMVVGQPPSAFSFSRTGSGRLGRWAVRAVPDAPSGANVLAQEDDDRTDYRFPLAVADAPSLRDVRVSVRCKPVQGRVDRACGIVWRYVDENNYYLTRANALENNVRLYYVQNGRRVQIAGWNGPVTSGTWHELRADMVGDHMEVYFNGAKVMDAHDGRFSTPGRIGLWTKADSQTLFDDLAATPREVSQ